MLLGGTAFALGGNLFEGAADAETRVARFDHIVDISLGSGLVGVGEQVVVFLFLLGEESFRVGFVLGRLG